MRYNFHRLFSCPPNSEAELFSNIKRCISITDPEWGKRLKPDLATDILHLEELVMQEYGMPLPPAYKMYLSQMGAMDGGLLSQSITYELASFYGHMAAGAVDYIKKTHEKYATEKVPDKRPMWYFAYSQFAGNGWGFSPTGKTPDQIAVYNGHTHAYANETFSKLLFYFAFRYMLAKAHSYCEEINDQTFKYLAGSYSPEAYACHMVNFAAEYPKEWTSSGHAPLINFLSKLEHEFSLQECWFSVNKKFNLFDADGQETIDPWEFSRYIGSSTTSDMIISIQNYYNSGANYPLWGKVHILSQDMNLTKQATDWILQRLKLSNMFPVRKL